MIYEKTINIEESEDLYLKD